VEQSTGRVYVLDGTRENGVVQVFSASGELLSSFGQRGVTGESIDEGPANIHRPLHRPLDGGLAVSNGTVVYVSDFKSPSTSSDAERTRNGLRSARHADV
jgi:hypothetical protein